MGSLFAFRLILLMLSAALLVGTSSPEDLTAGLKKILLPLKVFGIKGGRVTAIMVSAWSSIPVFRDKAGIFIRSRKFNGKPWKKLIPELSSLIVMMYRQAGEEAEDV